MLKTLIQRSGARTIVLGLLAWLAASIVEWVGLLPLPSPWDSIAARAAGLVAEVLLLLRLMWSQPSIDARVLPASMVGEMPLEDRTVVIQARMAQDRRKGS